MRGQERKNKVVFSGTIPAVVGRDPKREWAMSGCQLLITETANPRLAALCRSMVSPLGKVA